MPSAALGGTCYFFVGKRIDNIAWDGVLEAGGTFAGFLRDEVAFNPCGGEGEVNDPVDALVALRSPGFGEGVGIRNEEGVGEVVTMIDDAASGGALHELKVLAGEVGSGIGFGLEVAVAHPVARPLIEA